MTDNEITIKALKELLEVMLIEGDLQRISTISHTINFINSKNAEIERLNNNISAMATTLRNSAKATRADAIKEFAERVKEKACRISLSYKGEIIPESTEYHIGEVEINNLVKEMVGDV